MHHLRIDILLAAAIIAVDFVSWQALGGRFERVRLAIRLGLFLPLTYVLIKSGMSPFGPAPWAEDKLVHFFAQCVELAWWLQLAKVASALLDREVLPALWNRERLFRDVLSAAIFVAAGVAGIGNVLETPVTGLLATSGAVAVILGLAIQSTLGDVFSGIVLNATEPFQIGDWVFIGDIEGEIVESDWRATSLLNPQGNIVVIPNSVAAKANIVNHSRPPRMHGVSVILEIAPEEQTAKVVEALQYAVAGAVDVLAVPRPTIKALRATTDSIEYEIIAYVDDLSKKTGARNTLFDLSQRHLAAAGVFLRSLSVSSTPLGPLDRAVHLMRRVDMLNTLADSQISELARALDAQDYSPGQVIERTDTTGAGEQERLLIVGKGVVVLFIDRDGRELELRRMSPGDSIGQSAILAGVRVNGTLRAATPATILSLKKASLTPILQERPEIAKRMCKIVALQFERDQSLITESAVKTERTESFFEWLRERVKHLHDLVIDDQ